MTPDWPPHRRIHTPWRIRFSRAGIAVTRWAHVMAHRTPTFGYKVPDRDDWNRGPAVPDGTCPVCGGIGCPRCDARKQ